MKNKSIVFYYTWAGHTQRVAERIGEQVKGEIREIRSKTPYTKDYDMAVGQAMQEIRDGYLPPIEAIDWDVADYDVIYIGTPIWCGTMAPPVATFLSEHALAGKTIMPFTTHGGGGKGHLDVDIANMCKDATVRDTYVVYEGGVQTEDVAEWIERNNLTVEEAIEEKAEQAMK